MSHNLYEIFSARLTDDMAAPFLTTPDGVSYNFGQMDRRSGAMAHVLAEVGAKPGDRIVAQVEKSPDAIALYLACLRGGFVYTPLNPAYTPEEVGFFLGDADPAIFVCKPNRTDKLQPVAEIAGVPVTLTLSSKSTGSLAEAASAAPADDTIVGRDANDLAAMVYTSGTTGRSKGAMLTHEAIATNAKALHAIWRFRPGDVLLHALPIFHIHGLFVALHCALLNASEVLFLPKFETQTVREFLPKATVVMGVPTFYSRLLADPEFTSDSCQTVRMFTSGSAPLSEPLFHDFIARTGHTICERYGMTETGIIASNPPEGQRIAGTVGYALPAMDVRIADEKDEAVDPGTIGEVQVRGPHVFPGYWGQENKTLESFTGDGYFRTGDLGSMAADGRLALVGRVSDMIISGGYNVYPKEVELALDELPGVIESAVVGLDHDDLGEGVTAFIAAEQGPEGDYLVSESALREAIAEQLAGYKQPKAYVFIPSLPRNTMGKVQKVVLRDSHAELFVTRNL